MIRFRNVITIGRPRDEVFRFVADFENMPRWNYFVVEVHKHTPQAIGVGTVFHQTRRTDAQAYRVTEFAAGRRVAIETLPPTARVARRFTLEGEGNTTILSDEWELEGNGGLRGILAFVTSGRVKAAVAENLRKLKRLLENGQVILQDGRFVTI